MRKRICDEKLNCVKFICLWIEFICKKCLWYFCKVILFLLILVKVRCIKRNERLEFYKNLIVC